MDHVVMVVPVDAKKNEADHIARENRNQRFQRLERAFLGRVKFKHHDGDQDGENAVTKGFKSVLLHGSYLARGFQKRYFNSVQKASGASVQRIFLPAALDRGS